MLAPQSITIEFINLAYHQTLYGRWYAWI